MSKKEIDQIAQCYVDKQLATMFKGGRGRISATEKAALVRSVRKTVVSIRKP